MRVHRGLTIAVLSAAFTATALASVVPAGSAVTGMAAGAATGMAAGAGPTPTTATGTVTATATATEAGAGARTELPSIRLRQGPAAAPGAPVSYLIEVRNPGTEPLPNVAVHQLLSPGLGFSGARPEPAAVSAEQLRWTVALPPGETVRLRTRQTVATDGISFWNRLGLGDRPRLGITACVAPTPDSAVSGCDTALAEAVIGVPWWRAWYALATYALIAVLGVPAGIVWFRRRRSAHPGS